MDLEQERAKLPLIADKAARQRETYRVHGVYLLELALNSLAISKSGKGLDKEQIWRAVDAIQDLFYDNNSDPTPEQKMRLDNAAQTLRYEFE